MLPKQVGNASKIGENAHGSERFPLVVQTMTISVLRPFHPDWSKDIHAG